GARRFVQRIWRMIDDVAGKVPKGAKAAGEATPESLALRRAAHRALHAVGQGIEAFRFNVAVAQIYELSNVLSASAHKGGAALGPALREAAELLVTMIGPMMPPAAIRLTPSRITSKAS
ncbi:MAG TPA: hypothetical protein PK264_15175, partial [Hyphomicrobiaceae bacterium]|nr:hypothetical protein [Hyphomicrobiaceae bacterium]